jgi:hypothetical protein
MSLGLLFSLPNLSFADPTYVQPNATRSGYVDPAHVRPTTHNTYERPTAMAMTGDLLIARPALLAMTVVGAAVFVVSSPFSALGGNIGEAADTLVVGPAQATFLRCLGCTNGRKHHVDEVDGMAVNNGY